MSENLKTMQFRTYEGSYSFNYVETQENTVVY